MGVIGKSQMFIKSQNKKGVTKQRIAFILLLVYVVLVTSGFENIYWNSTYGGWFRNIVSFGLLGYLVCSHPNSCQYHFRPLVLLLIWIPFISIFNSWSIYSQSPSRSFLLMTSQSTWIIYFLLHKYRVQEQTILKVLLYIALFLVAIQIIQQFTYPNAPFGTVTDPDMLYKGSLETAEKRNGIWRFRMHQNGYYTTPILFALWIWARKKLNPKLVMFIALLLISIYLTLTRQVLFACILTIFCSMFMGQKKINVTALLMGLLLIGGLYIYYDTLFSSLAEKTQDESTDDNIRLLAASMLWGESLKSPFTFLFGYGLPDSSSAYGLHMYKLNSFLGVFTTDVGFIGQIFERGFIYVCVCYYMFYKLFFKLKKQIPTYIRMFVMFTSVMSIMIFPCITPAQTIVWVMLLYICDLHINKSPLAIV